MHFFDHVLGVQRTEVETLDLVLSSADSSEVPVPEDLVATRNENLDGVDTSNWRRVQDTVDVVLLALEGDTAKLDYVSA